MLSNLKVVDEFKMITMEDVDEDGETDEVTLRISAGKKRHGLLIFKSED